MELTRLRPIASGSIYAIGSFVFLVGSLLLNAAYALAIYLFIVGSLLFITAGTMDFVGAIRRRKKEKHAGESDLLLNQFKEEEDQHLTLAGTGQDSELHQGGVLDYYALIGPTIYFFGAFFFLVGSVIFLPVINTEAWINTLGTWVFRIGSLTYMVGSIRALVLLWRSKEEPAVPDAVPVAANFIQKYYMAVTPRAMWSAILITFIWGALMFMVGGVSFQLAILYLGIFSWASGSICFLLGSLGMVSESVRGFLGPTVV